MYRKTQFSLVKFREKEARLFAAHARSAALLQKYLPQLRPQWPHEWDFNLLHDLNGRIEARIHDHQRKYYDWHWDECGWNAYDV